MITNNNQIHWPPNYTQEFLLRQERIKLITSNPYLKAGVKEYYKERPIEYIEHWGVTYDPRNASTDIPTTMPFILFQRQKELVEFILSCVNDKEHGLVEKCRDMGATWICTSLSVFFWLFFGGAAIGWGSRKEQLVDKIGDPDSIFEKIRIQIEYTPSFLLPEGFKPKEHLSYMKCINPENGATITGEAGDNIGRGGRKLVYFKDESAHYERPEKIEAALGDNTECQIDISSVNGNGNIFARRRQSGEIWDVSKKDNFPKNKTRVFIFDWRDHPNKTQEWYDNRKSKAESEGLGHIFAQEVDRDYSASVEGILIPAIWVKSAIDLHKKIAGFKDTGITFGGLDVADNDGSGDTNSLSIRKGITLFYNDEWGGIDSGQTADKAITQCNMLGVKDLYYDCIGVGSGVKAEANRLLRENLLKTNIRILPWNAASSVLNPDDHYIPGDINTPKNSDMFKNLKAQAWWSLRCRFEKTYKYVTKGIVYPIEELINIQSSINNFHKLIEQISQPTYSKDMSGKIIVNKTPEGTKSPNLADSVNIAYFPCESSIRVGVW